MSPAAMQLHSAGGESPPPELAGDLRQLSRMPPEAMAKFWQALGPCIDAPDAEETARIFDVFAAAYGVPERDLAAALRACSFLINGAARLDLGEEDLAADIDRLCPEAPELKTLLLSNYAPAKKELRSRIIARAVADHGNMLVAAQWRVDVLDSSDGGARLRVPVVMLTLRYREGGELRSITLQVLPDMMGQLMGICQKVLVPAGQAGS